MRLHVIEGAVVVGLATYRLASLLVHEDGPWAVFERIRTRAGVPGPGEVAEATFWASLLSCTWCVSLWLAPALWLLWELVPIAAAILAAATISMIAGREVQR